MSRTVLVVAALLVVFGVRTAAPADERPLYLTFVIHLDPICGRASASTAERYRDERENLRWLVEFVEGLGHEDRKLAPRVLLEFGGDHADGYRTDPEGLELLRRAHRSGSFTFGTHFHDQVRIGKGVWKTLGGGPAELAKNRSGGRAWSQPGNRSTRDPQSCRRVTEDNVGAVDDLMAVLFDTEDAGVIRQHNRVVTGHMLDPRLALDLGFKTLTGGGNERLNLFFDCDVYRPMRPGRGLAEDRDSPWVLVPQMPPPGVIGEHSPLPAELPAEYREGMTWGVWQDLSLPAMRRKFLHAYLEWAGGGDRIHTFGWTTHTNNLYARADGYGDPRATRDEIRELVLWLNENFVRRGVARYASVDEVEAEYLAWETRNPEGSSFHYPYLETRLDRCPYRWKGVVRELEFSHHVREIDLGDGVHAHLLDKAEGRDWEFRGGDLVCRTPTEPILLLWADEDAVVDLSSCLGERVVLVQGETGKESAVDAHRVPIGTAPAVVKRARS